MRTTGQQMYRWLKTQFIFGCFLLCATSSFAQQNPLELFPEFQKREDQRERFIVEIIQLDSVLQYDDYLKRVSHIKWETISIRIEKKVLNLEFPDLFCKDYKILLDEDRLKNILRLKDQGKLSLYCRGIASELDVLPQRTGDIKKDCETYLALIKKVIGKHQAELDGLTFEGYTEMEKEENISTDSKRFLFRKRFLQFLNENYHVTFD